MERQINVCMLCLITAVCIWMKSPNKNLFFFFTVNPRHEVLLQRHFLYYLNVMSHGCRFVLCASGDLVKVYSTRTEEWLNSLQGHTNQVTGIAFNPANHLQVCVHYLSIERSLFWLAYFILYINNNLLLFINSAAGLLLLSRWHC